MIVPVLREIADEPLVLVGHSRGGCIATVIAGTNPELVKSLVITGSPLVRREVSAVAASIPLNQVHALQGASSAPKDGIGSTPHGSSDYRNASGIMRDVFVMMVNESYESELARVQAPIYMVWAKTTKVPVEVAKKAGVFIQSPHSLRVLDEVGHLVPLERRATSFKRCSRPWRERRQCRAGRAARLGWRRRTSVRGWLAARTPARALRRFVDCSVRFRWSNPAVASTRWARYGAFARSR